MREHDDEPKPNDEAARRSAADLVAYLDGELHPGERRLVEQRLATDPQARARLRALQQTWELLDELPRATENKSLTETTVAMATSAAGRSSRRVGTLFPRLKLLGALLLVGLLGFSLVHVPLKRRQNRQLRDLPVAQNIEIYRYAEDLEFLQALNDQGLFRQPESGEGEDSDDL